MTSELMVSGRRWRP